MQTPLVRSRCNRCGSPVFVFDNIMFETRRTMRVDPFSNIAPDKVFTESKIVSGDSPSTMRKHKKAVWKATLVDGLIQHDKVCSPRPSRTNERDGLVDRIEELERQVAALTTKLDSELPKQKPQEGEKVCGQCKEPHDGQFQTCDVCRDWRRKRRDHLKVEGKCTQCGKRRGEDGTSVKCRRCANRDYARKQR